MTEEKRFEILLEEMRGRFDLLLDCSKDLKEYKEYIDRKFEEHEKKKMKDLEL